MITTPLSFLNGSFNKLAIIKLILASMLSATQLLSSSEALGAASNQIQESAQIIVLNTKLKSAPQFLSKSVADLKFGDSLAIIRVEGPWLAVRTSRGKEGFVHISAVTKRSNSTDFNSRERPSRGVDSTEIVLAGKGFSRETESAYSASASNLDYAAVDKLDKLNISDDELAKFVSEGRLNR